MSVKVSSQALDRGTQLPLRESRRVAVLLSTHNGAAFLEAQIDSILGQTWPSLQLLIRDSGSTDGTWNLIEKWRRDPRVLALRGPNIGAKTSFLAMLGLVDIETEFVSFANQDGVWHPEKIARAVWALIDAPETKPALYCSRGWIARHDTGAIHTTPLWPRPPSFGNALVENIAIGGSILLNRPAASLLRNGGTPEGAASHDWWSYLVVSAFGSVIFDPRPALRIRLNGFNAARRCSISFCDRLTLIVAQARSFLSYFGKSPLLPDDDRRLAQTLAHGPAVARRALADNPRLACQFASTRLTDFSAY